MADTTKLKQAPTTSIAIGPGEAQSNGHDPMNCDDYNKSYMSLYGATTLTDDEDYSIDASAKKSTTVSMAASPQHKPLHRNIQQAPMKTKMNPGDKSLHDSLLRGASSALRSTASEATTLFSYQSIEEAFLELRYRRKSSVMDGAKGESPIYAAIWNMLACTGVVGLPVTYNSIGLVLGIVAMICIASMSVWTMRLLIITGKKVRCEDYERLVSKCFGGFGYYFISINILIFDIGSCVTYTIILGNCALDTMNYLLGGFWGTMQGRQVIIAALYVVIILPFCLGKNMEFIEKASAVAISVIALMVVFQSTTYYSKYRHVEVEGIKYFGDDLINALAALGTISFCFIVHDLGFLVYKTLKHNTVKRFTIMAYSAMSFQAFLCVSMSVFGYLSFGDKINDDILTNYSLTNMYALAMRILFMFRMAFIFPTAFYVTRHLCYAMVFRGHGTYEHAPRRKQILFTFMPWTMYLLIGLFVDDLGFVMSLTGLISGLNIAFVLPALCHLKVGTKYSVAFWTAPKGEKLIAFIDTFPCAFLVVFGVLVSGTGTIG
eukprot:491346_1